MTPEIDYDLIKVVPDADSSAWWEACGRGSLVVRKCSGCGYKFFPAFPCCSRCGSEALEWHPSNGIGTIYTYETVMQSTLAAFAQAAPYTVAIVELDDCRNADGTIVRLPAVLDQSDLEPAINAKVAVQFPPGGKGASAYPTFRVTETGPDCWRFDETA